MQTTQCSHSKIHHTLVPLLFLVLQAAGSCRVGSWGAELLKGYVISNNSPPCCESGCESCNLVRSLNAGTSDSAHALIPMVGHASQKADQLAAAAPRKAQRLPLNPLHALESSRSMAGSVSGPLLTCQLCSDPIDTEADEHIEVLFATWCG